MEWSKIKNIIILLLLLVNGFLLVLVGMRQGENRRYQQSALTQALQVLERSGIQVSQSGLEDAQGLSPQETGHPGQGAGQPAQADLLPAEPGQGAWRKTMVHGVPSFFGLVGFIINGNRGKPQFNVLSQFSHRPKEQPPPSPGTLGKGAVGWQEAAGGGRGNHPLRFWSSRIRL